VSTLASDQVANSKPADAICAQCGERRDQHHKRGKARGHDFVEKPARHLLGSKG